jgi:hypothetical protein
LTLTYKHLQYVILLLIFSKWDFNTSMHLYPDKSRIANTWTRANNTIRTLWKKRWDKCQSFRDELHLGFLDSDRALIHHELCKKLSFIITQIRTEKIGLADFLHKQKISDFDFSLCEYKQVRETAEHVIRWCSKYASAKLTLNLDQEVTLRELTSSAKKAKQLSSWWLNQDISEQFQLIKKISESLYTTEWFFSTQLVITETFICCIRNKLANYILEASHDLVYKLSIDV